MKFLPGLMVALLLCPGFTFAQKGARVGGAGCGWRKDSLAWSGAGEAPQGTSEGTETTPRPGTSAAADANANANAEVFGPAGASRRSACGRQSMGGP